MKRLRLSFSFCETEQQAREECAALDKAATRYCRKRYPAHYTPWESSSPTDRAHFIVWYHC